MEIPAYLLSNCALDYCAASDGCAERVKQNPVTGRWFITMAHAGFNCLTNNRDGYSTKEAALTANRRYARR